MVPATTFTGKTVAIFGLGVTGFATAAALKAVNATVLASDDSPQAVAKAADAGIELCDLRQADWQNIDAFVLSPGVPLTHPQPHWSVELARSHGVEIIGDIEIFIRELERHSPDANLVAITGTNGKSTTTALMGHVLKQAGINVQVGGNIGKPVLELDMPKAGEAVIIEFSSYQIDLTPALCPRVSILLNLSLDHIDRHGSMAGYADVKSRIFSAQEAGNVAVIGVDDEWTRGFTKMVPDEVQLIPISSQQVFGDGVYASDGCLYEARNGSVTKVADLNSAAALKGEHNGQNAAAVFAAARALGVSVDKIQDGFLTFPGLAHRMELIGKKGNVVFVNDSKATNADAAARALATFDDIYWIAGGLAKDGGIEELRPYFHKIKKAYLIGEAALQFDATLSGDVETEISTTIDAAVIAAERDAALNSGNSVVLLAPACASFDQFRNFELRGEAFRQAVAGIDGVNMKKAGNI